MGARARADWLAHVAKAVLTSPHAGLAPLLQPLIPKAGVVIDVGAHAGSTAKLFAALAPEGRVFAFEPGPYALSVLRITVSACGLGNVEIVPLGLSDAPVHAVLHMPVKARGGYGFGLSNLAPPDGSRPVIEAEITLTTLDAFAQDRGLTRLDFIKADIEGFEARFLRGAAGVLRRFRPACLLEVDERLLARAGAAANDVFAAFEPLGYAVRKLQADAVSGYAGPGDYLFTPRAS